ncbi:MAG: DUF4097 family beta strand repeat-containing protein [Coprobacillus sp.]
MKTTYKVIISFCVGVALIAIGVSLGGLSQVQGGHIFGHFDWRWDAERINDVNFEGDKKTSEFDISIHNGTVKFIETDDDTVRVKAYNVYDGFEVYESGNTLVIDQAHYWKWFRDYDSSEIQIFVPRDLNIEVAKFNASAGSLKVYDLRSDYAKFDVGAGNLSVDGVKCQEMKLDVGMGNANADNVTFTDELKINVGMGNADVELNGREVEYNYKMKVGLGTIKVGDEKTSGIGNDKSYRGLTDKLIDVNCGMGTVKVDMEG